MSDEKVVIHVKFLNDGTVTEIGERPDSLSPQQWFNWLSLNAGNYYRSYAGGRGAFTLPANDFDLLQRTSKAS